MSLTHWEIYYAVYLVKNPDAICANWLEPQCSRCALPGEKLALSATMARWSFGSGKSGKPMTF